MTFDWIFSTRGTTYRASSSLWGRGFAKVQSSSHNNENSSLFHTLHFLQWWGVKGTWLIEWAGLMCRGGEVNCFSEKIWSFVVSDQLSWDIPSAAEVRKRQTPAPPEKISTNQSTIVTTINQTHQSIEISNNRFISSETYTARTLSTRRSVSLQRIS